jgi:hypothetical protein
MNWFTKRIIVSQSDEEKQKQLHHDGGCEHVEADISLAYANHREMDSFGTVGSWVSSGAGMTSTLRKAMSRSSSATAARTSLRMWSACGATMPIVPQRLAVGKIHGGRLTPHSVILRYRSCALKSFGLE